MATEKQLRFIRTLAGERVIPPVVRARLETKMTGFDTKTASETIDWLLKQPKAVSDGFLNGNKVAREDSERASRLAAARPNLLATVPEGRYAVDLDDKLRFYRVDRPTQGKWAGRVFLNVQASDDWHPVHDWNTKRVVFDLIAVDPQAALLRYGKELGHCGHCGRTLTDADSRAKGIGPICAAKLSL